MKLLSKIFLASLFLFTSVFGAFSQEEVPVAQVNVEAILSNISEPGFPDKTFVVEPAKKGSSEKQINQQIEVCTNAGGGTVVLKAGEYFCHGPLVLKNNVNLHLEEGVRLAFSQDPKHYFPLVLVRWEGTEAYNYSPFIYAYEAENIAITGKGIIDGNGNAVNSFREWRPLQKKAQTNLREMGRDGVPVKERIFGEGSYLRPQLIHLVSCRNILLEDFTIVNGSFWLIQPAYCDNITIRGVQIDSQFINNDGVDLDSDTNVLIENCHFNTGDDFVAIKSGRDQDGWRVNKPSKNIIIRNCSSENCLHGISFGSELSGGIENVYVENLKFQKIRKYGLQFKSNKDRGGYLRNIHIKGVEIDTSRTCISFTNQYHSYSGGNSPTVFEQVLIEDVTCKVATEKGISMIGLQEQPLENIYLKNVSVLQSGEASVIDWVRNVFLFNLK